MLFFARKEFVFEISNPFKDKNVTALLTMMGPLIIGYSMVFINQQVDKVIVSGLSAGTITAMGYASVLSNFVCAFIGSICGVLFTYITKRIADKDYESAADLVKQFTAQMMTIFLPISIFSIVNSHDIVSLVFGHGNFDENAISSCAVALIGYSAMFAPYVFREILSRVQYAYEDSRHPMINSSIGIVFNIIFSIILSRYLGVLGVTLATSISVLISAILNLASTKKHNGSITFKYYLKYFPQWIVGGAICFGACFFIRRIMSDNPLVIRLLVSFVTSFAGYGLIVLPIILKTVKTIVFEEKKD